MERKAQNYTLNYKKWDFKIDEVEGWYYFVSIKYNNKGWIYLNTNEKTIELAKKRVEDFVETELK